MKPLKITLIGYGKMGQMLAELAAVRGHMIHGIIDQAEDWKKYAEVLSTSDIAIDFSIPEAAVDNMIHCFNAALPVVVGTTGWYDRLEEVQTMCSKAKAALFYAPNFSVGMNAVFALNLSLSRMLNQFDYRFSMEERHHIHKLDAPSGTAIRLATDIIENSNSQREWKISESQYFEEEVLPIKVVREGNIKGYHEVKAESKHEIIRLSHEALSREAFAAGALLAAEFLYGKTGVFTMKDLLKF